TPVSATASCSCRRGGPPSSPWAMASRPSTPPSWESWTSCSWTHAPSQLREPDVDDERIRQLTGEVLSQLGAPSGPVAADLESRVARLEGAVRALGASASPPAPVGTPRQGGAHPSLELLDVPPGSDHCILEPDKPCVRSGRCRTFGH